MKFPQILGNVPSRLAAVRGSLLLACLLTMLASIPLWLTSRLYPLLPISPEFPSVHAPMDRVVFGCALGCLLLALWFYRSAVAVFLVLSLYLALADQARWQPWFYLYWVMLLLTLARPPAALAACRIAVSAVYLWSGIQKCNADYFNIAVPWLAKAGVNWTPPIITSVLSSALAAAPAVEIFIGLAVWHARTRRLALALAVVVHLTALFLLGPLGHKHNWIVWPWNIIMPTLLFLLFPSKQPALTWFDLRQTRWAAAVIIFFAVTPALSFFGCWDSYLSFSLYTGHLTKADLYISEDVKARLPSPLLEFVVPTPPPYNKDIQGPYVVLVELWADKILRVPPLPESRGYRRVTQYLTQFATDPDDVRLVLAPRVGRVLFYRGSDLRKKAGVPLNL